MFYYIEGNLALIEANLAVVDCGGVGYALNTTLNTLSCVRIGDRVRLYVSSVIREDCFDLYGFYTQEEKRCFEMLLGVSGVGPKAALGILSSNTPDALSMAIISGNEKALTVVPGIGKKMAQRILLELKDKIDLAAVLKQPAMEAGGAPTVITDAFSEAVAALQSLGYSSSEALKTVRSIDAGDDWTVDQILQEAFRKLASF